MSTQINTPNLILDESEDELKNNYNKVIDRINECSNYLRNSKSTVTLIAVSKYQPIQKIVYLNEKCSHYDFGENYVSELIEKAKKCSERIRWHFIGNLQTNKIKQLSEVNNLVCIHSLDSLKRAKFLEDAYKERNKQIRVFIQINTTKNGISLLSNQSNNSSKNEDTGCFKKLYELIEFVIYNCKFIKLEGIMTIGSISQSWSSANEENNEDFERLLELKRILDSKYNLDLKLSMGMSNDYEIAIKKYHATHVRVGSLIFGSRNK